MTWSKSLDLGFQNSRTHRICQGSGEYEKQHPKRSPSPKIQYHKCNEKNIQGQPGEFVAQDQERLVQKRIVQVLVDPDQDFRVDAVEKLKHFGEYRKHGLDRLHELHGSDHTPACRRQGFSQMAFCSLLNSRASAMKDVPKSAIRIPQCSLLSASCHRVSHEKRAEIRNLQSAMFFPLCFIVSYFYLPWHW
jgi:hypothetical protein